MKILIFILVCYFCTASCYNEQPEWLTHDEGTKVFGDGPVPIYGMVTIDIPSRRVKRNAVDRLSLDIPFTDRTIIHCNLKKTDGILADKDTPVWLAHSLPNSDQIQYFRNMTLENLGNFEFYQDYDQKASIIIFHDQNRANGFIGKHSLKKITPSLIGRTRSDNTYVVVPTDEHSYIPAVKNSQNWQNIGNIPAASRNQRPTTVYPQLLIQLRQPKDKEDAMELLRLTLVYWNAVDMLYSNFTEPRIKINIAGIILPINGFTTPWITKTIIPGKDTAIHSKITLSEQGKHFEKYKHVFPPDKYDIMIHFSEKSLDPVLIIVGRSFINVPCGLRAFQVILLHRESNYITAAHELAHIFSAQHTEDTKCADNKGIMWSLTSGAPENFQWSECDRNSIKNYFSTTESQCFDNSPSTKQHDNDILLPSVPINCLSTPKGICAAYGQFYTGYMTCNVIYCNYANRIIYRMTVLDGTICIGSDARVFSACHQGKCIPVDKSKPFCSRTGIY